MIALVLSLCLSRAVLSVGDGFPYSRIEEALAAAHSGDRIDVHPKAGGYPRTALKIAVPNISIVGIGSSPIQIDGSGYDYSGVGSVPRAIMQVDSDLVVIQNFELFGAHNDSHNGSGIRINQGSNVTISGCVIHGNDMGIMSNGAQGNDHAAENQIIDRCRIYSNGDPSNPGYNHNLYLGGTSVTVQFCDIYGALTGHNLKSRAHFILVRYCYIHHSANRELDLVEDWDTQRANSNAVLIGNLIVKDPDCTGNRATIHFGVESGQRVGNLYLINNTIVSFFLSGIVALTTANGEVKFFDNVICNTSQSTPHLLDLGNGASLKNVSGASNWISSGYSIVGTKIDSSTRWSGATWHDGPGFGQNYALPNQPPQWLYSTASYLDGQGAKRSIAPTHRYNGSEWQQANVRSKWIGAG